MVNSNYREHYREELTKRIASVPADANRFNVYLKALTDVYLNALEEKYDVYLYSGETFDDFTFHECRDELEYMTKTSDAADGVSIQANLEIEAVIRECYRQLPAMKDTPFFLSNGRMHCWEGTGVKQWNIWCQNRRAGKDCTIPKLDSDDSDLRPVVLITGASGFLGNKLIKYLYERKAFRLVGLVHNFNRFQNCDLPQGIPIYRGSVDDPILLTRILHEQKVDIICNLAAAATRDIVAKRPIEAFDSNESALRNLYKVIRDTNAAIKCLIFPSTTLLYGDSERCDEDARITVSDNDDAYMQSKFFAETWVKKFASSFNIPSVILRLSNVYGYGDTPRRLVSKTFSNLSMNLPMKVSVDCKGAAKSVDLIFEDDVLVALHLTLERVLQGEMFCENSYKIFNIATGTSTSVFDVVSCIAAMVKGDPKNWVVKETSEEIFESAKTIKTEKAERVLGFKASVSVEDGLRRIYEAEFAEQPVA